MIHPDTELRFIGPEVGFGVVATRLIPKGTLTWVFDELDRRLPPERVRQLPALYERRVAHYGYQDQRGWTVMLGDHARYVNHSCDPTCISAGWDPIDVARRDIQPGEQLSNDYAELGVELGFPCRCGTPSCAGRVEPTAPNPLIWRAALRSLSDSMRSVEQPLAVLLEAHAAVANLLRDSDHLTLEPSGLIS